MSLVGVACGVYLAADKHRRARLAGVEITPQNPLEAVLAQSGVEFPNLEAVLVRLMGDTPEAKDAASIIVNHPDPAQLIREFAMRSTAPKTEESATTSTSSPPPTATPTPPPSSASSPAESSPAESATAPPPPQAPPAAPSAAEPQQPPPAPQPSVFAPGPDYAPSPAHGAAYVPNYAPAAQTYHPGYAPQGAVFRPDYAPQPPTQWPGYAPHAPMYRADYAPPPGAYRPGYAPSPPPRGVPPLPAFPHHARAGGRFRPPPVPRPRPTSQPSPDAPAPSPSDPPTSAAPDRDAASSEPRTFLDWMRDKLATLERAKEDELAETRRIIAANRGELAEIQRRIAAIEEARSSEAATATTVDVDPPALEDTDRVEQDADIDLEIPSDAELPSASVSEPSVEDDEPVDETITVAAQVPDDPTAIEEHDPEPTPPVGPATDATPPAEPLKIEALHLRTADERDPDEPPLPTPVEMAEAARLFQLHEQRMRDLDGIRRQELAEHGEEIRQVKDICTALARVEAPHQASPISP